MTVTRRRSETVTGFRGVAGPVGAVAPGAAIWTGVPHVAQNRAPGTSADPQLAQAAARVDPHCGQNLASAGAVSPQVGQVIGHRVPNRALATSAVSRPPSSSLRAGSNRLHDYASNLYSHTP